MLRCRKVALAQHRVVAQANGRRAINPKLAGRRAVSVHVSAVAAADSRVRDLAVWDLT